MKYHFRGGPYDGKYVEYNFLVPKLIYIEYVRTKVVFSDYYVEHIYQAKDLTAPEPLEIDYVGAEKKQIRFIDTFNNQKPK